MVSEHCELPRCLVLSRALHFYYFLAEVTLGIPGAQTQYFPGVPPREGGRDAAPAGSSGSDPPLTPPLPKAGVAILGWKKG